MTPRVPHPEPSAGEVAAPHPEVPAERASKDQPERHPFRIHFHDGHTEDVRAVSAAEARASRKTAGAILKVKLIREKNQ